MDQHQMPPLPVEYTISPRAKKALKGKWPTALLVAFGASLLTTLFQVVYTIQLTPAMESMNAQLQQGYPLEYVMQVVLEGLKASVLPVLLLGLAALLFTPVLNMGYRAYCFKLLRGEEGLLSDLFSRKGLFFKSLGQSLMIGLRVFLWGMLGAVIVTALLLGVTFMGLDYATVLSVTPVLSLGAVVLVVMADYRYKLAPLAMADDPSMGINASIRLSARLMKKRKLRLLGLTVGWMLLSQIGGTLLQTMLGTVVGLALSMMVTLACSVVVQMITVSFYLTYREVDGI